MSTSSYSLRRTRQPTQPADGSMAWEAVFEQDKELQAEILQDEDQSYSSSGSDFEDDETYEAKTKPLRPQPVIDPALLIDGPILEEAVEEDIQDDFQRLLEEMNGSDEVTASTFSRDLEQSEADMELRQQMRAAARIGKPKGQPGQRRAHYSHEVRDLLADAQHAFIERRTEEAIRLAREVIRIEPRAVEGWSVLAGAYQDLEDHDNALKFRIVRAHLKPDTQTWKDLAEESQRMGLSRQALYCYRKALQLDKTDIDAIWDRAFLLKEMGDYQRALEGFESLLKLVPHDPNVLQQIYQVCVQLEDLQRALALYQSAFAYHRQFPPTEDLFGVSSIATLADLHIALGNYEQAAQAVKASVRWLQERAAETFWERVDDDREYDPEGSVRQNEMLEGQEQDEDDVPPAHNPLPLELRHRLALARLRAGDDAEAQIHIEILRSVDTELHPEYFDFYLQIADAYFDRTMWEEAYEIYEDVHSRLEAVSVLLLSRMSKCLRNLSRIEDAIAVLEHVVEKASDDLEVKLDLAELYEAAGRLQEAFRLVTEVQEARRRQVWADATDARESSLDRDGRNVFEEPFRIDKEGKGKKPLGPQERLALEQQRAEIARRTFENMKQLEERVEADDPAAVRAWMQDARRMIDTFRQARILFPSSRYGRKYATYVGKSDRSGGGTSKTGDIDREAADIATRLQEEMEEDAEKGKDSRNEVQRTYNDAFHGIGFDDWVLLIVRYTFRLLRQGDHHEADDILRHTSYAIVFTQPQYQDVFAIALLACAIFMKDHKQVLELSRKLIFSHQFNDDAVRIFVAALGGGINGYIAFTDTKMAKFLTRELKIVNAVARGAEVRFHVARQRYVVPVKPGTRVQGDEDEEDEEDDRNTMEEPTVDEDQVEGTSIGEVDLSVPTASKGRVVPKRPLKLPTTDDPVMLTVYAHMLLAVRSYQSALFYLLHAYELNPYDPMMCLTIAVCYVGRAMQRQSDNRHHQIVQGLAFLSRYRLNRTRTDMYDEEVEYNFGRYFHQLGLLNLAEKHYGKVLQQARKKARSGEGISAHAPVKEAAYNLSLIYSTTGAGDIAEAIYNEWLTL